MKANAFFSALAVGILVCHFTEGIQVWEGDSIDLPCDRANDTTDVEWRHKSKKWPQGTKVAIRFQTGEQVVDGPWSDDGYISANSSLHITITNYTRDEGLFQCDDSENYFDVQIGRPVADVSITHPSLPVMPGTHVGFTCQVDGGHPAPNITWYLEDSSTPVMTELGDSARVSEYTPTVTRVSEYTVTVTREMNGQRLVCEASVWDKSRRGHILITLHGKDIKSPEESKHGDSDSVDFSLAGMIIPWCLVVMGLQVGLGLFVYRRFCRETLPPNDRSCSEATQTDLKTGPPLNERSGHYVTVHFDPEAVRAARANRPDPPEMARDSNPPAYADIDFSKFSKMMKNSRC